MSNVEGVRGPVLWRERLPWLILLRAFRPAVSARMLICAAGGLAMTIAGWRLLWMMFLGYSKSDRLLERLAMHVQTTPDQVWPAWPWNKEITTFGMEGLLWHVQAPLLLKKVAASIWQLTLPFQFIFDGEIGLPGLSFSLLCGLWALAVWALLGGMMTRTVALQLTRQETIPWSQAHGFALRHWFDYFTAPLYPLLGVLLLTVPVLLLGVIARLDIGALLVGLLWPLALLAGLLMALLLLGLFFGWPLMWGTVSVEGNDAFDALSRSYAYVFQRPLHYLFYALVAVVLGTLGYVLVQFFAEGVIALSGWAASWGTGNTRIGMLLGWPGSAAIESGSGYYAVRLFAMWTGLVRLIAAGFAISYLWSATTAIYLLLRRDVDAAEMDEVQLEQEERFGLPSLTTDERGVPGVAEGTPAAGEKPVSEEE